MLGALVLCMLFVYVCVCGGGGPCTCIYFLCKLLLSGVREGWYQCRCVSTGFVCTDVVGCVWLIKWGALAWRVSSIAEVGLRCVRACVVGRGGGLYVCGEYV